MTSDDADGNNYHHREFLRRTWDTVHRKQVYKLSSNPQLLEICICCWR